MPRYLKIECRKLGNEQKEILIALLSDMPFLGFEEEEASLNAYICQPDFNEEEFKKIAQTHNLSFSVTQMEDRNWNREWESNFHPVIIYRPETNIPFAAIRAGFHEPILNVEHEIIITPKMSFGTGHHPTTSMMVEMMSGLDLKQACVLDFGTGTGILSILAGKMGADTIIAIDIDDQSIENATENFKSNHCHTIQLRQQSSATVGQQFNFILANIIKQVILENMGTMANQLLAGGSILLSGLLVDDQPDVVKQAKNKGLIVVKKIETTAWICLQMKHEFDPC